MTPAFRRAVGPTGIGLALLLGLIVMVVGLYFVATRKTTSGLKVTSNPGGAEVYLDNKMVGTTPLELEDLPPGTYQLRIQRSGGERRQENVILRPGETSLASFVFGAEGS